MKLLTTAISSALLLLSAASSYAQEQVNLRMSWWGGNARHQATLEGIAAFEKKYPHIKISPEYTGFEGYLPRLTTQIAGGNEPDVIQSNWNWLPIFSKDGTGFYDIKRLSDTFDLTQYPAEELELATINHKINGIPVAVTARSFYYNKTTWEKLGIPYPTTWDELFAAGDKFKAYDEQYYPLVMDYMESLTLLRSYMVQKYNIPAIDEANKKFTYSDAQWVEFFELYKKLVDRHVIPSTKVLASYGKGNTWEMKAWIDGYWGGMYMWNTNITMHAGNLKPPSKIELGPFFMLPEAKDAGLFFKPTMVLSISKTTKHPQEAALLMNFLLNEPEGVKLLALQRGVPLSKQAVNYLEQHGMIENDGPVSAGLASSLSLPHAIATSPYFDLPQLITLYHETIQDIDYGKKTVNEAAASFSKQGERLLQRAMR